MQYSAAFIQSWHSLGLRLQLGNKPSFQRAAGPTSDFLPVLFTYTGSPSLYQMCCPHCHAGPTWWGWPGRAEIPPGMLPMELGTEMPLYKLPFTEEYFLLFLPCLELCKDNLRDGCIFLRWWKENTMSISLWKKEMQNICLTIKTAKEFSLNHNS